MKRLLAALAIAPVLTASPAVADYRACMEFCTKEHGFARCDNICRGRAGNTPTTDAEAGKSQPPIPEVLKGRDCSTHRLKAKTLWDYIQKTYKPYGSVVLPREEDTDTFQVGFFQRDKQRYCRAWMKIADDCRAASIARTGTLPPLRPETGGYFVKVELGELKCVFAED